ncbi:discoidin domain-containing protein [Rubinisphaera margarita]|uniref:discoidin domain-containing protein n=1 Tax=Rubinisphaera margarita TaxID=2909586 RepID=UPI001EE86A34|nr:discoidin domain-containing protein [Rubinisphaera margarita]MCG6156550.1 discoidin domain-containing protein [Rubinisphaera margarita]
MRLNATVLILGLLTLFAHSNSLPAAEPVSVSGVYPHLRMWNNEGECGTGAVVLWQGDLWAITYAPHMPGGSSDKLYQITPDLEQIIFEGSVGGTPANRMIHPESNQLLIGPYLIDAEKSIRVIPPGKMFGRLTGNARHLTDPAGKVYYATMEEGLYEVDVETLDVRCLIRDGNSGAPEKGIPSRLPGYHGKGLYSGQGRVVYANNGDRDPRVKVDPTVPSGALAQWFGQGDWQLVRRNQFTEVTGPGGIHGSENPKTDPIWSMGWDQKSLLLALLEDGTWHFYRLPKGSHSYDGAHGWNTEWPRIREIGEADLLATMHGTFWQFPADFSVKNSAGIAPRSNYLKVIGDFCRWNDRIVFGCDDSAKAEFLNTRPFKSPHGAPLQSNSNLWFVAPEQLDDFGPAIGRGSVWLREDVDAGTVSDPYLFAGYDYRQLHLTHESNKPVQITIEVDREGSNDWKTLQTVEIPAGEAVSHVFSPEESATWVRLRADQPATQLTAHFQYRNRDERRPTNDPMFAGLATLDDKPETTGLMQSLSYNKLGLAVPADKSGSIGYYEIDSQLQLQRVDDPAAAARLIEAVRQPEQTVTVDDASVLLIEDGKRYRLPKNDRYPQWKRPAARQTQGLTLADVLDQSLALDATVKTSSIHGEYAPHFAVDGRIGNDEARWISTSGEKGAIEIDLGQPQTFRSLWVVSGWLQDPQYVARNFDVQIRDGGDWRTLEQGTVRRNHQIEHEIVFDEPVTAQELRIVAAETGHLRIYEIALFKNSPEIQRANPLDFGPPRVCREAATERDLLNVHGTFYELPARNAQGLAKVRPVATHNLTIHDFCSHNGLLFFTGLDRSTESEHIFRSADGQAAVWAGVIDDLWKLGKPRGVGGPWNRTSVKADQPSDPYLMTGYDRKSVQIQSAAACQIRLEVDVDGTGLWIPYRSFELKAGDELQHEFEEGFSAYWVRAIADADTTATVMFRYE